MAGKYKVKTKIQFYSCHGVATRIDRFDKALTASEAYSLDRGYRCEVCWCGLCHTFHVCPLLSVEERRRRAAEHIEWVFSHMKAPKRKVEKPPRIPKPKKSPTSAGMR
jgi:hypothetical protein